MITIRPFAAVRPEPQHAKAVASLPYDVLSSKEAKEEAQGNPNSFLHVTKSEIDLPESTDVHSEAVYIKAKENLDAFVSRKLLFRENKPCYYIYKLTMNGRSQAGLVCGSSLVDYESGLIKKHEYTRPEKELDRINHIKITGAQTGNVFLAYKTVNAIDEVLNARMDKDPQYDFTADDGIRHSIWVVNDDASIKNISSLFSKHVPCSYIADGHHRAASAAKVRGNEGGEPSHDDIFLTTLFPADQLAIMDYNRIIKDMNGLTEPQLLERLSENFDIEKQDDVFKPAAHHEFGLYVNKHRYRLRAKGHTLTDDVIGKLDISILQKYFLSPVLNIQDQRTDPRIDFVGGIRGIEGLEQRVDSGDAAIAISLYPVSIQQLFDVADSGSVMPPKSTWFEPKLRDGLLTNLLSK